MVQRPQAIPGRLVGPSASDPKPADDPRTQRVQAILERSWPTIQKKFNVAMPTPIALVLDTEVTNAFAMFDPRVGRMADAVIVLSPILSQSDEDLEAILVHELGHIVMKNVMPAYAIAVQKFYEADRNEPLGITAVDDAAARSLGEPYLADVTRVGAFPLVELHGVPLGAGGLTSFFFSYTSKHNVPQNPACTVFWDQIRKAIGVINSGASTAEGTVTLSDDQRRELDLAVTTMQTNSFACINPPANVDLGTAFAESFSTTESLLLQQLAPGTDALYRGKDALTGVYDVTEHIRAGMRAVAGAPGFAKLRQYTSEEQSDDFAMTVLHAQGKDATRMGTAVLQLNIQAEQDHCNAVLATGAVPSYGITDIHHSNCYRKYHSKAFAAYLHSGGTGVVPVTAPLFLEAVPFDPTRDRIAAD